MTKTVEILEWREELDHFVRIDMFFFGIYLKTKQFMFAIDGLVPLE